MRYLSTILAAGLVLGTAQVASAADMGRPVYKAAPAPVMMAYNWTGFYAGIHGGYAWGEQDNVLTALGVGGNLKRTMESTNPCESMIEIVRRTQRNVKRWSSGEMALRWTAAGMLEAERQFRKIIGYRDLATLVVAIEREHDHRRHAAAARTPTKEEAIVATV